MKTRERKQSNIILQTKGNLICHVGTVGEIFQGPVQKGWRHKSWAIQSIMYN